MNGSMSNTQLLLIVILVLAILFVLGKCKLHCKGRKYEGWADQVRDHVSNPYQADILSNCNRNLATPRTIPCGYAASMLGPWDRSEPLTARAQKLAYFEQGQQEAQDVAMLEQGGAM